MEAHDAYNKHAKLQASGAASALPFLEKAAQNVALEPGDRPVVIADYGSSQGKNSLAPMRVAIRALRTRLGRDRPIFVHHVDQASNDFNTLFRVLDTDPDAYTLHEPNVFSCAIGNSFYRRVLPSDYVHLAWSSYAAVWLSRIPALIPDHFVFLRSTGEVRAAFDSQAAKDWEAFLSLRASELRPGGRLVVVLPALDDDGTTGFEDLMDHANAVLMDMTDEGLISPDERARMVIGACPRRKRDLLAPFQRDGQFQRLTVQDCELSVLPDVAWAEYERHGDKDALAMRQALFFRSTFMPSLALALDSTRGAEDRRAFADSLEDGLKRRLADRPEPLHSLVETMVLAKQGSA